MQPIHLPDDDRGVVDAAARPGGGAIAAIVGGVSLVRADGSGGSPVDLLPRLAGPQPGAVEASLGAKRTEELAVMVDTFHPFKVTAEAMQIEDPDYWKSWSKPNTGPAAQGQVETTGD